MYQNPLTTNFITMLVDYEALNCFQGTVIKKILDTILENIYSQKYPHTLPTENHHGPWETSQPHKKPQARSTFSFFSAKIQREVVTC
jgi:hypothetical protein